MDLNIDQQLYICSYCHKSLYKDSFLRKNFKNTGIIRQFKICNICQINKIKKKFDIQNNILNNKLNFFSPYINNNNDGKKED